MNNLETYGDIRPLSLWQSHEERRAVLFLKDSPVRVLAPGSFRVPFFGFFSRDFDQVRYVVTGVRSIVCEFDGEVNTMDGIAMRGRLVANARVKAGESSIIRMAIAEENENNRIAELMLKAAQDTLSTVAYEDAVPLNEERAKAFRSLTLEKCGVSESVLELVDANIGELTASDADVRRTFEEKARRKAELDLDFQSHQMKISQDRDIVEILSTFEGQLALVPDVARRLKEKELEVEILKDREQQKLMLTLVKAASSFEHGQTSALRALMQTHLKVDLPENLNTPLSSLIDQEIERLDHENEKSQNDEKEAPDSKETCTNE